MRRLWASGAVLALGLAGVVAAADDDPPPPPQSGWGAHGVYRHKDKPPEKPPEKEKPAVEDVKPQTSNRERELNALARRLAICDRLRAIAQETNDTELEHQADGLERRIHTLFQQRANRMPLGDPDDSGPPRKASMAEPTSKDSATRTAGPREVLP
jgi:hypothetical protein